MIKSGSRVKVNRLKWLPLNLATLLFFLFSSMQTYSEPSLKVDSEISNKNSNWKQVQTLSITGPHIILQVMKPESDSSICQNIIFSGTTENNPIDGIYVVGKYSNLDGRYIYLTADKDGKYKIFMAVLWLEKCTVSESHYKEITFTGPKSYNEAKSQYKVMVSNLMSEPS